MSAGSASHSFSIPIIPSFLQHLRPAAPSRPAAVCRVSRALPLHTHLQRGQNALRELGHPHPFRFSLPPPRMEQSGGHLPWVHPRSGVSPLRAASQPGSAITKSRGYPSFWSSLGPRCCCKEQGGSCPSTSQPSFPPRDFLLPARLQAGRCCKCRYKYSLSWIHLLHPDATHAGDLSPLLGIQQV